MISNLRARLVSVWRRTTRRSKVLPGKLVTSAAKHEVQIAKLRSQIDTLKKQVVENRALMNERLLENRKLSAASLASQRGELTLLRREVGKADRHAYGSYTPGVREWERRWRDSPGRRVLLYAWKDYAGSFMKWADVINRHTPYAARLAVFNRHAYGYELDLLFPHPAACASEFESLVDEADIVHIKDESGFFTGAHGLPSGLLYGSGLRKKYVFTHYGGYARRYRDDPAYRDYVQQFDARVAMTPDLCYDWFDGRLIAHPVDTDVFSYSWNDGVVVGHSPSTMDRKGTELLVAALEGLPVSLELIHGVSHAECLERKRHVNVFFDQAGREVEARLGTDVVIGWYGNSALEAAVHGIPTIAHLSEDAFVNAARSGKDIRDRCAIMNTPPTSDGISQVLLSYFNSSPEERADLSKRTRRWIEEFHGNRAVAGELERLYDEVLGVTWSPTDGSGRGAGQA